MKLQDTFIKQKQADGNRSGNAQSDGRIAKGGSASGGSDIYKIVKVCTRSSFIIVALNFSAIICI